MRGALRPKVRRGERAGAIIVTATVLVATLAIWAFPLGGLAAAQPAAGTAPSGTSTLWAYGGINTENVSWQGAHGVYVGTVTYGFSVVLSQTNTSSTTYTLSENQTVGAVINLTYCRPNCRTPTVTEQYSYRALEAWNDLTNFTTTASVILKNGTSVDAVGIVSSNASIAANITEELTAVRNGTTHVLNELFASASARFSLNFTPALGLFPLSLTPNAIWTGSAAFTAAGSWESEFLAVNSVGSVGPVQTAGDLAGSGTATIHGTDRGSVVLSHRSLTQVATRLNVLPIVGSVAFMAGFDLMDGFAILPHVANLVQSSSTASWDSRAVGNITATTALTDLGARSGSAPESFAASAWTYSTAISNPDPSSSGASNTVQGAPITPAQASLASNCLEGTASCGIFATSPSSASVAGGGLLPVAFLSIGTIAVVVIVGGLLISQRRRIPPPSYPNAALYPPGGSRSGAGGAAEPTGTEPPSDEDDPLQDLW
ncbi:MAG: hypothetical protein WAN74_04520 [Thermoplasmata archaeon]